MGFFHDLWYGPSASGQTANHSTLTELIVASALQNGTFNPPGLDVPSVYRCRQMNADTLGSVPVMVGDSLVPAPNKDQGTQEFIVEACLGMMDSGEAYVHVDDSGNMEILPKRQVDVRWNTDQTRRIYSRTTSGETFRDRSSFSREPNLYVLPMNRGAGDLRGLGPMQNDRIAGIVATQNYSSEYFKHHGKPSGVLKVPSEPTSDEATLLKAQWDSARQIRSTAIISQQMDYTATSFSPNDSEYVESAKFNMIEVANLFGVPPVLIGASVGGSSLTYQAIGDVYQGYWRMSLFPTFAKRIGDMWTQVLGESVTFNPEHLFLASLRDRAQATWQLTSMGYEPAGVLDAVGLPKIAHTGEVPTTLQPVDGGSNADRPV